MKAKSIENDQELQRVLWACYKYWQSESSQPPSERVICYSWVLRVFEERFGARFHQSNLRSLANLGFLQQDVTSRHGGRRYYKLIVPEQVHTLLKKWNLH